MARNQTERSQRRDPVLNVEDRPVRLEQNRRFFTSQGNRGPIDKARALQDALGFGVETYVDVLKERNVEGEQRALGDAASGKGRDINDKNKGYEETWQRIEATQDLALFRKELSQMMVDEDWDQLSHEEVQERIDAYFNNQLAGINMESVYGQTIAPAILAQNATLLETHANAFAARELEEYRSGAYSAFIDDLEVNGEPNYDMLADFASNLPSEEKKLFYWESLTDAAEQLRDLSILDNVPERLPNGDLTGINDPRMLEDVINPARARIQALIDADKEAFEEAYNAQYQGQRAAAHSDLTQRAKEGDPSVIQDIFSGGLDGPNGEPRLLTRPQQKTLFDQYNAARETAGIDANSAQLFGAGLAYDMTPAEFDNAASQYAARLAEQLEAQNPDMDPAEIQATVRAAVLERSYVHDEIPQYIKSFMQVTPASPERFQRAFDMYLEMEAHDPRFAARAVGDRQAAMFDSYRLLLNDAGDPERALEMMNQYDHTIANTMRKEIEAAADAALADLADPWGPGDWQVTGRDRRRALELGRHYANMGYGQDEIEGFIRAGMESRNVRVADHLYPVDAGWSSNGNEAAEWYLNSVAHEFGSDPDLIIEPHPNVHGQVIIRDRSQILPYSVPPVAIRDIEQAYARHQQETLEAGAQAHRMSSAEERALAEERAFNRMYPENPWMEPGQRSSLRQQQRDRWANMEPAVRDRLIDAEFAQQ